MRLLVPAMLVLAACGSGGHGRTGGAGGAGGRPSDMTGPSPDAADALAMGDAGTSSDAMDAAPLFSCALVPDAGGAAGCIQPDPGYPDAGGLCASAGAGPVAAGPCARDSSAGGCHQVSGSGAGYTTWWYAPLGLGAVLTLCEQMGASYVSP